MNLRSKISRLNNLSIIFFLIAGILLFSAGCGKSEKDPAEEISSALSVSEVEKSTIADVSKEESSQTETSKEASQYTDVAKEEEPEYSGEKLCYLTFDDGPSDNTLKVLDILKDYNIKATFFVIGSSDLHYTKRIAEEGHTVGLHCNQHDYGKIYSSTDAYFADLNTISQKVEQACGVKSNIVRFPGGTSNTASSSYCTGIMTELSQLVPEKGYYYFDWNADSGDASGNNVAVDTIMQHIDEGGTSSKNLVVLMHDSAAKDTTVEALPQIIEFYRDAGYTFAPLTPESKPVRHSPNN